MNFLFKSFGFLTWVASAFSAVYGNPAHTAQTAPAAKAEAPKIIGAMKEVMWGGRLSGKVDIDTRHVHFYLKSPRPSIAQRSMW
jgi:hypothetical protein